MKRLLSTGVGILLFVSPAAALAQSAIPIGQTPAQLLTTVAAIQAQEAALAGKPLACAMLFSEPSVSVGEQVILAWGSVGAIEQTHDPENMRDLDGAATLSFQKSGTWTYSFIFYAADGSSTTCTAKIDVQ